MKPRYWKRKPAQVVLEAARKKVSRGTRYFTDAKELLALVQEKLLLEHAALQARIEALENPQLPIKALMATDPVRVSGVAQMPGESPKAMFDRRLRELEESE